MGNNNKYRIVFDLDGVLRELNTYLNEKYNMPYPNNWIWKYKNKDMYDWVKYDDYKILLDAPKTEYVDMVNKIFKKVELWSCQPKEWRKFTKKWVKKYFKNCKLIFLEPKQKIERLKKSKNVLLVEDFPNFEDYTNIILIDKPYNKNTTAKIRIKNPKELEEICETLKKE